MTTAETGVAEPLSPSRLARTAGAFQLLEGLTATFGQVYLLNTFVVAGDPAATARRVLANEPLFQLGFAAAVLAVVFQIGRALAMFELLRIVRADLAKLALLVMLIGCALQAVSAVFYIGIAYVLKGGALPLPADAARSAALVLFKLNAHAFNAYLVFFGIWNLLTGYLIWRSAFMPRILGLLLMVTGLGWMLHLYPLLAREAGLAMMATGAIGEIPLLLWLLAKGVDEETWRRQARSAAS